MPTLAAAQQVAVTASSSLSRSSSSSVFRHSLPSYRTAVIVSAIPICNRRAYRAEPCSATSSSAILFLGTGFRTRSVFLGSSGKRATTLSQDNERSRVKKRIDIRSLASRKDRREMENGTADAEFEPDIGSLKSGLAKRFPGEDVSRFRYDLGSDDEDDGVQVKSFKSTSYGRAQSSTPSVSAREGYSMRTGNRTSRDTRGAPAMRSPEQVGYERRKAESYGGRGGGSQDYRSQGGVSRGELDGADYGSSGRFFGESGGHGAPTQEYRSLRGGTEGSGSGRGYNEGARSFRSPGETRVNPGTPRNLREGDRKAGRGSGRKAYGGGEWSRDTPVFEEDKKKKPVIEPVNFTSAMSKDPHVAILGGGMSGLVCALTLEEHGIQSTVFDTGKHGLGGRMGTRYMEERDGEKLVFDHAAQFFTVTNPRFQKLVDRWISQGAVKEWTGNIGTLQAGGHYTELPNATRYIGTNGMRSLADRMLSQARQINVKRPCWISSMEAVDGRWKLTENRKPQGEFDAVVIAHNGKCANRLLSTAHVPLIARQMKRLELSSIWALLAAFKEPIPLPRDEIFDGAFVDGVDSVSWMGNNSRKLVLPGDKTTQCWTFFSSAAYGRKNKVPQESIPIAKAQKVTSEMLRGVETALGLSEDSLPTPFFTRVQLWGAALPTNMPDVPCIFDARGRVGICGDWLIGSSLEAAALSGMALADHIANYHNHGDQNGEEFNIGLQSSFAGVIGHDIGQFPGTEELPKQSPQELLAIA